MSQTTDATNDFERVQDGNEVFYSIYSRYAGEVLHFDPEQMRELQQWLTEHAAALDSDVQSC